MGVRGAFLRCENKHMGRFCNTTQPASSQACAPHPTPTYSPFPTLCASSHLSPSSCSISASPDLQACSPPYPHPLFPCSLSSLLVPCSFASVPLAACPGPLSYALMEGPWELEFTAKQEEPVSRKLGVGQGVISQQ